MIMRVSVLSDEMLCDCYDIVTFFMGKRNYFDFYVQDKINSGRGLMFVDVQDNKLNGFVIGRLRGAVAYIDDLYVVNDLHRSGIGTGLLNAYQDYAVKTGAKQLVLMSRNTDQALNFYKKTGFVRLGFSNKMQKTL